MKKIYLLLLITFAFHSFSIAQTRTVGATGADYATLKAAFDAINSGSISGSIVLQIIDNTTETATAVLNAPGSGVSSIKIYPTVAGKTISGNLSAPLIDLNGADNVTIDGRINETGLQDLIITNTSTSSIAGTSTIRFINDAKSNTVKYCTIKGSSASSSAGIIFFSGSTQTEGNDDNLIDNNNITSDAGRPVNAIYSSGSDGLFNNSNIVTNNSIYNFLKHGTNSNGIYLGSNTTGWTISGNSFYETTTFSPTANVTFNVIRIANSSGTGFTISDNFIGGSSALCSGTWTKTNFNNIFYGIHLSANDNNSIQNNTIKNFTWSNSGAAAWTAIYIASGAASIGTASGNTIGSGTGTGSITITGGATGSKVYGVNIATGGYVECKNNIIGSITASNGANNSSSIYSINKTPISGTTIISGNLIGSTSTTNSIYSGSASSANIQDVIGISCSGTSGITISNNTISNLANATTNPEGSVTGIYSNNGAEAVRVFSNFIHSLIANGGSGTAKIQGLKIDESSDFNDAKYFNNIISLGGNSKSEVYGIYENNSTGHTQLYFNTINVFGNPSSGSENSYALYNIEDGGTRDFINNIFVNSRSNNGSSGSHYSVRLEGTSNLNLDYNDYFISGSGGVLGYFNDDITTLAGWQSATVMDAGSQNLNPSFANPAGTSAVDYKTSAGIQAVSGTPITSDFALSGRGVNPSMGAWEWTLNKWKGSFSTNWGTAENWTANSVPGNDAQILFDDNPARDLYMDMNRSVTNITNGQSAFRLVTNGYKLTVKGNLVLTNGAQIDASAVNSTVEFSGSVSQSIPSGAFYNNQVYNLAINNPGNVTLTGALVLLGSLTSSNGLLDAGGSTADFTFGGSISQIIESNRFLNNKIYNLTIDNSIGVNLNTNFTIDNNMVINAGKKFTIGATRLLTVTGTLTNNAGNSGLVIQSDGSGDGKLINSTAAVPGTVQLYLTGGEVSTDVGRWHYFVPPVASMDICTNPAWPTGMNQIMTNLEITNFWGDLMQFDESLTETSQDDGWQYFDNYPASPASLIIPTLFSSRGYNFYAESDNVLKFKGNLNAGEHIFNLSFNADFDGEGWNLIGNPYPSNYDLNAVPGLGSVIDGISNTVYYNNNGNYYTWNPITGGSTGYSDIVPPMTGFFVLKTKATGPASLTFPVTGKTPASADTRALHKGSRNTPESSEFVIPRIRLELSKGSSIDETQVVLMDDATMAFNEHYDALKLFGKDISSPNIYSSLSSVDYALKSVPPPASTPVVVPLTVKIREAGNHTITFTGFENLDGTDVILKHGFVQTMVTEGATYIFTPSGTGTFTDFELIIGGMATGDETLPADKFKAWYSNGFLNINTPALNSNNVARAIIYDLQGKPVYSNYKLSLTPGGTINVPVNLQKGVYMVHIVADNKPFVAKIIVL